MASEQELFEQLDLDNNGVIDEEELAKAVAAQGLEIDAQHLFEMLDRNQDGVIDRNEFHGFYEMMFGDEPPEPADTEPAEQVDPSVIATEIMDELADGADVLDASEAADFSSGYFGVDRDAFIRLLSSNGYTLESKLSKSDVEGLVSLCDSFGQMNNDIDLDDSDYDDDDERDKFDFEDDLESDDGLLDDRQLRRTDSVVCTRYEYIWGC